MRVIRSGTAVLATLLCTLAAHAADPAFTLVVQTDVTVFYSSNDHQFTLPLYPGYDYDATVAWGDGTTSELTSDTSPTHTYASIGTYAVKITEHIPGGFPAIRFDNATDGYKVRELSNWGDVHWATFNGAFSYCSNMQITAADSATARTGGVSDFTNAWYECRTMTDFPLIDTGSATTLAGAWRGCDHLTSFPRLDTVRVTNLASTWHECSSLTAFPLLDTHAVTSFYDTWNECSGLTHFPLLDSSAVIDFSLAWNFCSSLVDFPRLDTAKGTTFTSTWGYCSALAVFPAIDTRRGVDFGQAWRSCPGLTAFPLLNTAKGTNFSYAWNQCSGLTAFPAINTARAVFCTKAWESCTHLSTFPALALGQCTDFTSSWADCTGLTAFPALDTSHGTVFTSTWSGCHQIHDFPLLALQGMTEGTGCFANVTLPIATYDRMLTALAGAGSATGVFFDAGGSNRYHAATAHDTLTAGRGWTIIDGGALPLVTSTRHATAFTDTAFSYQLGLAAEASSATVSSLPGWLGFDSGTGLVSGTAPHATGSTSFVITATAGDGAVERVTVALDIVPGSAFTLLIDTTQTESGSPGDHQFTLPLGSSYFYDCTVAWGDGTFQTISSNVSPTHTYVSPGIHAVALSENHPGGFPTICFNNGGDCGKVLELRNWGTNRWLSLNSSFNGCRRMVITADDGATAATGTVTDFGNAWTNCTALTSFPLIDTSSGRNFSNAWTNCSGLTSFPAIATGSATDLSYAWAACSGLTSFPLLDTATVTYFDGAWTGCSRLISFPTLDTGAGTTFGETWSRCQGLTSFPLLDTSAGTYFAGTWADCQHLSTFPPLDMRHGTTFDSAWKECSGLTSFPAISLQAAVSLNATWQGCAGLTSFPVIDTATVTGFEQAWRFCSGLTDFPLLDTRAATSFYAAWDGCSALAHFPLLDSAAVIDFRSAWQSCAGLTSFPALDTGSGTLFSAAWADCTGLTSFPALDTARGLLLLDTWRGCSAIRSFPFLDLHRMTAGDRCFQGVTLETATYDRMLNSLAAGATATGVLFDAGATNTYTASAAHDHLTGELGWTIVDASLPPTLRSALICFWSPDEPFAYIVDIVGGSGFAVGDLPAWLSYDAGTRTLSGRTPWTVGQDSFTITAHGVHGETVLFTVRIYYSHLDSAPFVSPVDATYTIGGTTPPSYQITASNSPTSYGASGLPDGLTLDPHSGLITGNAVGAHPGSYQVLITASNADGTGAALIHLTLAGEVPPPPNDDTSATNPAHCGLGGGVALILMLGLGLIGRLSTRARR